MIKVFLGGTTQGWDWRKILEEEFKGDDRLELFNPLVDDWNEEAQRKEREYRKNCDICLQVITPYVSGVYSIAEIVDDSNKRPDKTHFVVLDSCPMVKEDLHNKMHLIPGVVGLKNIISEVFHIPSSHGCDNSETIVLKNMDRKMLHSLQATKDLITENGGRVYDNLEDFVQEIYRLIRRE